MSPKKNQKNLVLVTVSGKDAPGITAEITRVLSESGVNILDIGQAVIHQLLSLSILFELNPEIHTDEKTPIKDLLFVASELGLNLNFQIIKDTDPAYPAGTTPATTENGKPLAPKHSQKYALTLIGSTITAGALYQVASLLASHAFNIDRIDRLSEGDFGCVELQVSNRDPSNAKDMRKKLLAIARNEQIDIAFQVEGPFRKVKRLIVFDMDSTLIQCEIIDEFARELGKYNEVAAITHRSMNGQMDFDESLRLRCEYLKGLTLTQIENVIERMELTPGAADLIRVLKKLGYKIGIISGGFSCISERLREKLGIDYAYANHLEFIDGICTGKVIGPIINAQRKADLLETLSQQERIALDQVVAIGDGANDLLMLEKAGLGVAFNAKPIVFERARHSINQKNLKSILYLLGLSEQDLIRLLG